MRKDSTSYILPFSAKSKEALDHTADRVLAYLRENDQIDLRDAAWTLQKGRRSYAVRKAAVASRNDLKHDSVTICSMNTGDGEKKANLVLVLPDVQDAREVWNFEEETAKEYPVLAYYQKVAAQVLSLFPAQIAQQIQDTSKNEEEVEAYRAFISGYASVNMLLEAGIQPTALAGVGVGELSAMVCAKSLSAKDAVQILLQAGALPSYEGIYSQYEIKNKQIPVMRKAGKKAKMYLDEAVVIRLGSKALTNDITVRCMTDVAQENQIALVENPLEAWSSNVYIALAELWCKGIKLDWTKIAGTKTPYRVPLPGYAFDKKIFDSDALFGGYLDQTAAKTADTSYITYNPTEVLKGLWKDILGVENPEKQDDFFDLGGSSLDAIMLTSKIKEILKIDFQTSEVFDYSTFGKMEKYLNDHRNEGFEDIIQKLGKQEYYETSSAQKRMYAVNEMLEDAIPYNLATVYHVHGKIDKDKIQNCFATLVRRHEAFRTRFEMAGDEVVQIIEEKVDFHVIFENCEKENLEAKIQENIKPFDLATAPLLRVAFLSLSEEEHVMILDMHHIISDQSSIDVLLREISMIYQGADLPELDIQYKDFAKWQNDFFRSGEVKKQLEYWKNEFANGIPVLNLYTDYNRPEVMEYGGGKLHFAFPEDLNQKVTAISRKYGVTPYMFTMAALNIMLWKYTRQKEIVIGTAIAGRKHAGLEKIVGMFVNTLAIKSDIKEDSTVAEYLQYTKDKMLGAYDNQDCQFDMLVEELGVPKSTARNPLFDILFNYINIGTGEVEVEGLSMEPYEDGKIDIKFDLTFTLEEKNQKYNLDIEYAKSLYCRDTIELMGQRFIYVVTQMAEEAVGNIGEITIMSEEERKWLMETVNQTATEYPADKTVLQVFEQCVQEAPDSIAIEWMDEKITYRQLNNMANQLAVILQKKNIGYQEMVPILLERGPLQMVSILGIMKLGAVYIPVDPKFPKERAQYILNDCKGRVLVTAGELKETAGEGIEIIDLDEPENQLYKDADSGITSPFTPAEFNSEDLIYVIYTSGSTGNPKGTLLKHKNVMRVVKNTNYIEIQKEDRVLQISNYVFDCSVFDIYSALLNGACLVIIPRETALEIPSLADFIMEKRISVCVISTALFHMLVDWKPEALMNVRKVIAAGEQLSLPHAKKTIEVIGKGKLLNGYGPTESAVFATYYSVDDLTDAPIVPIGWPIANTTVYVTDENQNILPINVAGELCIGGDGIGRGYLNQEDLTKEKFIHLEADGGKRVYRTGDRVMWNTKRELIFLGRMDFQVKIRGFRVELGEVERLIEEMEGINSAVVISDTDNLGTVYMIAYYTVDDYSKRDTYDKNYIRGILESKVPEYMIPSKYMLLKQFPLNFSGKVDRKALPKVTEQVHVTTAVKDMPRTPLEAQILDAMKKILEVEELGIKDDFFRCGGQSIKAIALVKELNKQGIAIKVNDIFQCPTAEKAAGLIEPYEEPEAEPSEELTVSDVILNEKQREQIVQYLLRETDAYGNLVLACDKGMEFPMSAIQKGHYSTGAAHSGFTAEVTGHFTEKKMKAAVGAVISNNQLLHSVLASSVSEGETEALHWLTYDVTDIQEIAGNYLAYGDVSMYAEEVKESIRQRLCDVLFNQEYKDGTLLWRICILKKDADTHEIIWSTNHVIFDGMSGQVIMHQIEEKLGKRKANADKTVKDYSDYVTLLQDGPDGMTEQDIVEQFALTEWSRNNEQLVKQSSKTDAELSGKVELKIPLRDKKQDDIWWYAFDVVSDILRAYTDIENVPYAILDYGRSYREQDFYNSVGEFLDIIPVLGSKGKTVSIEDILSMCRKHGINFLTLLGEEKMQKAFPQLNTLLRKYYDTEKGYFDFVLYNFQGYVTKEEKKAFANVSEEGSLSKTEIVVNYDDDTLYIEMEDAEGLDADKLLELANARINEED